MGFTAMPLRPLAFGSKGNCIGELLGEENKGMKAMFVMMNEARLGVGLQGFGFAMRPMSMQSIMQKKESRART